VGSSSGTDDIATSALLGINALIGTFWIARTGPDHLVGMMRPARRPDQVPV
jgi:hypothetical protein